jgi:hypothetical protein
MEIPMALMKLTINRRDVDADDCGYCGAPFATGDAVYMEEWGDDGYCSMGCARADGNEPDVESEGDES